MASVAEREGVAIGTAYVHYHSKDELVFATCVEQKQELSGAGARAIEPDRGTRRAVPPAMARYLPRLVPDCRRQYGAPLLVDLPMLVLYDLGIGPAVRMAAAQGLDPDSALNLVAADC